MKKQVFIPSTGRVLVNGKQIPRLLLTIIQGSIGKHFVVKHYKGRKIVITRYPDMRGIVASEKQRERRDLFKEAVVYAKWILADAERKKAFRKTLPRRKQRKVYQAAIQLYMSKQGDKQWLRKQLAVKAMFRGQAMNKVIKWVWGQEDNRKSAMDNQSEGVYGALLVGSSYPGSWRVLWAKERYTDKQVVEHSGSKDCLMAWRTLWKALVL